MDLLYSKEKIESHITTQARDIYWEWCDEEIVFLVLTEGGRRFANTLLQNYKGPYKQLELSTKRTRKKSLGDVTLVNADKFKYSDFENKVVVILDDIFDEGRTILKAMCFVLKFKPKTIEFVTMLQKTKEVLPLDSFTQGLWIKKDEWVVGYGMDLDGKYRDLDDIYVV
jgi:hypoxanthine phosphoribosyltransferase